MGGTFYCNVSYVQDPTHFTFRNQGEGVCPGGVCLPRGVSAHGDVSAHGVSAGGGGCLPDTTL